MKINIFQDKKTGEKVSSILTVLIIAFLFLINPKYSAGQPFGFWPGLMNSNSGFWSTAPGITSTYTFGSGYMGQTGMASFYNSRGFSSPGVNFGSSLGIPEGIPDFVPQGGLLGSQGFAVSPTIRGGFSLGIGALGISGWFYPNQTNFFQNSYAGGFQTFNPFRTSTSQNFSQFINPFGGGFNQLTNSYAGGFSQFTNPFTGGFSANQNLWGLPAYPWSGAFTPQPYNPDIAVLPPVSGGQGNGTQYVPNQILVKFKDGVSHEMQMQIHDKHGCKVIDFSEYGGFIVLEIPSDKTVEEMVNTYLQEPEVAVAEPNLIRSSHFIPNVKYFYYKIYHSC